MTAPLDVEMRILNYLRGRAAIEGGVWCQRARTFLDFLVYQHGEPALSEAMLNRLDQNGIVCRRAFSGRMRHPLGWTQE
jgi:hypothetical protein